MAHQLTWLVPDHVLLATLHGPIAADEVQIIADEIYNAIAALGEHLPIHTLIDVRESTIQDKVWNYAKLNFRRHDPAGWSIVIGDSRLAGLVIAIFSKILNLPIRYSDTTESALKSLSEHHLAIADYLAK